MSKNKIIVRQSLFIVCTRWFSTGLILLFSNTKTLANSHLLEGFSYIIGLLLVVICITYQ
jgi:hypothetical protein